MLRLEEFFDEDELLPTPLLFRLLYNRFRERFPDPEPDPSAAK